MGALLPQASPRVLLPVGLQQAADLLIQILRQGQRSGCIKQVSCFKFNISYTKKAGSGDKSRPAREDTLKGDQNERRNQKGGQSGAGEGDRR